MSIIYCDAKIERTSTRSGIPSAALIVTWFSRHPRGPRESLGHLLISGDMNSLCLMHGLGIIMGECK
jgi:hypothetical protein